MSDNQTQNQNNDEKEKKDEQTADESKDQESENQPDAKVKDDSQEQHKSSFFHRECKHCEKYKKEANDFKAGWQRALADYHNLQKEVAARRAELVQMSELQILEEFLPVYDHFKLAFGLQTSDFSNGHEQWVSGIKHIMQEFGNILKAHGIEEIKTVGEMFDPRLHESVGEEESDQPEHVIVREVEGGYSMNGKVVKPAKVVIAKMRQTQE